MLNRNPLAYTNNFALSTNPCKLIGLTAYSKAATDTYLQLHDSATPPVNGAIPWVSMKVPATSNCALSYGVDSPRSFTLGMYACLSTTHNTLTLAASDLWIDAQLQPNM